VPVEVALAAQAEKLIHLTSIHFSWAIRFFYMSIPLAFAAAGSIPFVVSSLAIFFFLIYIDHSVS
jgi:hypothetical protein